MSQYDYGDNGNGGRGDQAHGNANPYASPSRPPQYPHVGPAQPANYYQGGKTSMPVVALVLGIVGFFTGILVSVAALVVGVIGRKKAKKFNQPTGMATAGIILGVIGTIWNIVLLVLVLSLGLLVNVGQQNIQAGQAVDQASAAADLYYAAKGTYEGITAESLTAYGWEPDGKTTIQVMPSVDAPGDEICIEGVEDSGVSAHKVSVEGVAVKGADAGGTSMEWTYNGVTSSWTTGVCPNGFTPR